jgi:hypothetical protein
MPIRGVRLTLRDGISRIVNGKETFKSHPDHIEPSEGHPPLTAFLGVSLRQSGKIIGMVGLGNKEGGYDIADQEAVETLSVAIVEAFRKKRAELEIERLNKVLKQHTIQLGAANKELESFSYSVSHDLRTPLRAIDGFSYILLEEHQDQLDDEGKRLLGIVRENTEKMAQLIDDILSFSRRYPFLLPHGTQRDDNDKDRFRKTRNHCVWRTQSTRHRERDRLQCKNTP